MNIDDVGFKQGEVSDICRKARLKDSKLAIRCNNGHSCASCPIPQKTAQLKLLEWLKEDCLHGLVGVKRGQCSECMSELEAKLTEG
jgi:hypothetical protein